MGMLNQHSIEQVAAARRSKDLAIPLYDTYCFSQLPQLLRSTFGLSPTPGMPASVLQSLPTQYRKVVLFLLDGFGWTFFSRYAERFPFLRRFIEQGVASKLTSQFPSTTSVHMTTLHTGLTLAESGVPEWWYYEPLLDQLFAPLLFATKAGQRTTAHLGPSAQLFPTMTLYQELGNAGVRSYCFQHRSYAHSPFSSSVSRGATAMPFKTIAEGLVNLVEAMAAERERAYFCVYLDPIDGLSHPYGPNSTQVDAEAESMFLMLESIVQNNLAGTGDTLLLLTADHGQTSVSSPEAIYLDEQLPSITQWLKTNQKGQLITPAGGPRDVFLYVKEECLSEAYQTLSAWLQDKATVYQTSQLLSDGFFGREPSTRLIERLGNLTILAQDDRLISWGDSGRQRLHYKGHHGGLSSDELEIPLLALAY
jgi:predicted AlkP superfamily pyrophosphatase or phosphodiesterase